MMQRTLVVLLAGFAALAGAVVATHEMAPAVAGGAASANTFFSQSFPDASGKQHVFSDYRGKVVVINFWATWCVPCVKEIPELSKISTEYSQRNVVFVGIGIDNASSIAEFQQKIPTSYPLLVAGATGSDLVREFGDTAGALPYTLILDDKGTVRATKLGPISEKELRAWLKPLVHS